MVNLGPSERMPSVQSLRHVLRYVLDGAAKVRARYPRGMTITARYRLERALPSAIGIRALSAPQHPGTNGWVSEWGTNAHGEIAGCPPSAV